ncbi:MAG: hypothetical protein DDT19_01496 [Syntrophomonadaceae bacterium]|nr:hypothetical protein [Bacillota bacterium]
MYFIVVLIGSVIMAVAFTFFLKTPTLNMADYNKLAVMTASAEHFRTGISPPSVSVLGKTVSVDKNIVSDIRKFQQEAIGRIRHRKTVIEQAVINACIAALAACNRRERELLWGYMPSRRGEVSELLTGATSDRALDCATATADDYKRFIRGTLQSQLNLQSVSPMVFDGITYRFFYNKPQTGHGCGYTQLIEAVPTS